MPLTLLSETNRRRTWLSDPALRRALERAVRRRIRGDEAEDVVQATLADVLSAASVPDEPVAFRRFVFGVARHKVLDHFRRADREHPEEHGAEPHDSEPPHSARDILRWAEEGLPDSESKHTLEWMLREGDGEKLEHIARDANLPAARVRKRVSRLRRFFRERWAAELLVAGLCLLIGIAWYAVSRRKPLEIVTPERETPRPIDEGQSIRRFALERCRGGDAARCLDDLDRAKKLDPAGDKAPEVTAARRAAASRLSPAPSAPAPTLSATTPAPSATTPAGPRRVRTTNPSDSWSEPSSGQK